MTQKIYEQSQKYNLSILCIKFKHVSTTIASENEADLHWYIHIFCYTKSICMYYENFTVCISSLSNEKKYILMISGYTVA